MHTFSFFLMVSAIVVLVAGKNISEHFNSECDQVFTKNKFIIESKDYPTNYPLNYQCFYLLKGPTCPTNFTLQFLDFSVEDSLGCSKDRLEIDDRDALCGNRNNEVKTYFSEKGTLILKFVSDKENTGRGYRIFVTRSSCQTHEVATQQVPKWYTTNVDVEYTTTKRPQYGENSGKCCQTFYNSKQFVLTSPNFPNSMSIPADCYYEIYKMHDNICRLRIHVQFFWLGRQNSCIEGFLEIDGKRICGCKNDLKIIVPFEGQNSKTIRFHSKGYERTSYSGFVMDIIQDECPKKVVPEESEKSGTIEKKFRFYNDQINRVAWPNDSREDVIEKLHLISQNTEIIADNEKDEYGKAQPQVFRHVYFYSVPDYHRFPRDHEETEYIDTSSKTSFNEDKTDYYLCRNWNQIQFNSLSLRHLPICKTNEGSVAKRKCVELNQQQGYFKSPGYPFYYPGNKNICYRFQRLQGYCTILVYMDDFNLQNGATCEYDYLLFANHLRYCGNLLKNTISTIDIRNKPYEQMNFVTDALYCGRGFFGRYKQIPCQETYPINPTTPSTNPPYTPPPLEPCSRIVQEEMFTFDVYYDYNQHSCSLKVRKYAEHVCLLKIYFEKFDLICASESLTIDGTLYCGRLTGQSVTVDITNKDPLIVYKRTTNVGLNGLRLRIKGIQLSDECPVPEVPAERFLRPKLENKGKFDNKTMYMVKFDHNFKDVCGIITNITEFKLPETFCDLLMKNDNNITNCVPLRDNSLSVPVESQKIELKIKDTAKSEEIQFQEIDCDGL